MKVVVKEEKKKNKPVAYKDLKDRQFFVHSSKPSPFNWVYQKFITHKGEEVTYDIANKLLTWTGESGSATLVMNRGTYWSALRTQRSWCGWRMCLAGRCSGMKE